MILQLGREPAEALAWSETRLERIEPDAPVIALWLPRGLTVAVGISQLPERETYVDALRRDAVTLMRRQSGGGAVLLHPGVLCWESLADIRDIERFGGKGSGIRESYAVLCRPVIDALRQIGVEAFQAGICDISVRLGDDSRDVRKLAGTAQLRRRDKVLVHGSLLVSPDMALLERYLRFPSEEPNYRRGRSHSEFCLGVDQAANIADAGICMRLVVEALHRTAHAEGWRLETPAALAGDTTYAAAYAKYSSPQWNLEKKRMRNRPSFPNE